MAETLKVVMVGCGGMSSVWLKTAKEIPGLEMVGLVDINADAARKRKDEFGFAQAITDTDLSAVLNKTKPDMVFDCTILEAHVNVTLTALAHGCHVMGEKPMADSMDNARRMVEAAQEAGKLYAVIQNRRYQPMARRVQHFLQQDNVGRLTTVNCDFYIGAHFGGFRDHMQHVLLLDMAIHTFDAARFLTGTDPVAVYCKEWNPDGSWYDHDASAIAIFEMTNGVVYTYRGSWCAEGMNTTWECDWRFIGNKGSATWNGGDDFKGQVVAETGSFFSKHSDASLPEVDTAGKVDGHAGLIREFVHCVRAGGTPETLCTDNIKSLAMVFGAIESATSGTRVVIKA
ncbi:MAG: Gfo/Idh/MocA family oxidoreductase [Chloroflexi bacterium]|nr:Gfo/Idh/MocA family oxidoreductase [Chloroflexota bacterium]